MPVIAPDGTRHDGLTVAAAAAGVSRKTVKKWADTGYLGWRFESADEAMPLVDPAQGWAEGLALTAQARIKAGQCGFCW